MGVFPTVQFLPLSARGLPHACGGVSMDATVSEELERSSPRMWGCFLRVLSDVYSQEVFPTHVGVFPLFAIPVMTTMRLPHACGGVSGIVVETHTHTGSSPRMWGCFLAWTLLHAAFMVFPTHVGVFPLLQRGLHTSKSLPHACGGVSRLLEKVRRFLWSSPRMWGCFLFFLLRSFICFVFPTHVGVFL